MKRLLPLVTLAAAVAAPVSAQEIIGVSWSGDAYSIDFATGVGTHLGSTGYAKLNSMAKASDGTMYAMSDGVLI